MIGRCVAAFPIGAALAIVIAACGGKVDGFSVSGSPSPSATATTGRRPGGGTGGRVPAAMTPDSVAAQIAESYCKAFSSCCVAAGQPPTDVSRCRELTTTAVLSKFAKSPAALDAAVAETCVQTIADRMAVCGKEDVAFWGPGVVALLQPASVAFACAPLTGVMATTSMAPCSDLEKKSCDKGGLCAIDECSSQPARVGAACADDNKCLDSLICTSGVCQARSTNGVGADCKTQDDCALGLACFASACAPARDHVDAYTERFSPYRVDAETCRAFTFL